MTSDGLIVVDKPAGMTSHDVVARIRRLAKTRRVGHAGTLDPMATGVLIIGVNKATRLLTYVVGKDKSYSATIRLGQSTITDDAEGDVTATFPVAGVSAEAIRTALERDDDRDRLDPIRARGRRRGRFVRVIPALGAEHELDAGEGQQVTKIGCVEKIFCGVICLRAVCAHCGDALHDVPVRLRARHAGVQAHVDVCQRLELLEQDLVRHFGLRRESGVTAARVERRLVLAARRQMVVVAIKCADVMLERAI